MARARRSSSSPAQQKGGRSHVVFTPLLWCLRSLVRREGSAIRSLPRSVECGAARAVEWGRSRNWFGDVPPRISRKHAHDAPVRPYTYTTCIAVLRKWTSTRDRVALSATFCDCCTIERERSSSRSVEILSASNSQTSVSCAFTFPGLSTKTSGERQQPAVPRPPLHLLERYSPSNSGRPQVAAGCCMPSASRPRPPRYPMRGNRPGSLVCPSLSLFEQQHLDVL